MTNEVVFEEVDRVVERIANLLQDSYAFPEIGEKMAEHILSRHDEGVYREISSYSQIGSQVTADLREVEVDLHLAVYYHPDQAAELERRGLERNPDDPDLYWWQQRKVDNFGLQKLEILPGNVGYFKLLVLAPVSLGGEKIIQAMNFLSDCDALIFDLRECGGGDPYTVQLIESYLFKAEPKLLLTLFDRPSEKSQQIWTLPSVVGKRMPDVPVYILTSGRTFSGGEDLSYVMKHHRRATVVGEITGGGGHTVEFMSAGEGFVIVIPTGYPIHPVTGGNWEGVGVQPDIETSAEEALQVAHLHALETLLGGCEDEASLRLLAAALARQRAAYQPVVLDEDYLQQFVGEYGGYQTVLKDGRLTLGENGGRESWKMTPITETRFMVDDEYDAAFEFNDEGQVMALVWHEIATGREIRSQKREG
jgi:hypothetical protein